MSVNERSVENVEKVHIQGPFGPVFVSITLATYKDRPSVFLRACTPHPEGEHPASVDGYLSEPATDSAPPGPPEEVRCYGRLVTLYVSIQCPGAWLLNWPGLPRALSSLFGVARGHGVKLGWLAETPALTPFPTRLSQKRCGIDEMIRVTDELVFGEWLTHKQRGAILADYDDADLVDELGEVRNG